MDGYSWRDVYVTFNVFEGTGSGDNGALTDNDVISYETNIRLPSNVKKVAGYQIMKYRLPKPNINSIGFKPIVMLSIKEFEPSTLISNDDRLNGYVAALYTGHINDSASNAGMEPSCPVFFEPRQIAQLNISLKDANGNVHTNDEPVSDSVRHTQIWMRILTQCD
jgi:hypothetical protein